VRTEELRARTIEESLRAIAEGFRRNADGYASLVAAEIIPHMPDLGVDGERQIKRSAMANIEILAELFDQAGQTADVRPLDVPPPPPQTLNYLRMLVHRSLDVDSLVRGYRIGHAALSRCCSREAFAAIEDRELLPPVLERCSDILFRFIDASTQHVSDEFHVERYAYTRWPVARRVQTVLGLLSGEQDPRTDDLSTALGYEIGRWHLGLVVKVEKDTKGTGGRDVTAGPRVEVIAMRLSRVIASGERPLVLPMGNDVAWAWVGGDHDFDTEATAELQEIVRANGATVGIGESGQGRAGFRETNAQARDALDVGLLTGASLTRYRVSGVVGVLMAEPERARRLMRYHLGGLNSDSSSAARLRETLSVLLVANLNQREAARRIGAHPHTIAYRLQQIEEAVGGDVSERAHALHAALLIREALGHRGSMG
jgi:hypothetical protein